MVNKLLWSASASSLDSTLGPFAALLFWDCPSPALLSKSRGLFPCANKASRVLVKISLPETAAEACSSSSNYRKPSLHDLASWSLIARLCGGGGDRSQFCLSSLQQRSLTSGLRYLAAHNLRRPRTLCLSIGRAQGRHARKSKLQSMTMAQQAGSISF